MFLLVGDLTPFKTIDTAKATEMIKDVEALALVAAPGLSGELSDQQRAAVKAVLRAAVLRWDDTGTGAITQETIAAGPFNHGITTDSRQGRYGQLWPSEESALQKIVSSTRRNAYTIDMTGGLTTTHQPWCAVAFGANYCSCGADIAGSALYED